MKQVDRLYVCPEFKRMIKMKALESHMTVVDLTEDIAKKEDPLKELAKSFEQKRKKFDFV